MMTKILAFIITFGIAVIRIMVAGYVVGETISNFKEQKWFLCGVNFVLSVWGIYGLITTKLF